MSTPKPIQSVNLALNIIECLFSADGESSISEISAVTGMNGSTIFRQLATLKERGYIYQNPATQKYGLGLRFYAIGNKVKAQLPIIFVLGPALESLAKKYRLSACISIPDFSSDVCAQQAVVFRKSFSPVMQRNELPAGSVTVSHGSATGKCMMAYYPAPLIRQYGEHPLIKLTDKTITDWSVLLAEFATIRSMGYALDCEEEIDGQSCVAVPVLDSSGQIIAAMSLFGQTSSVFDNPVNALVSGLLTVSNLVSGKL